MRIDCDTPGVDDCWVDVSESWSRREIDGVSSATGEQFAELMATKLDGCHLRKSDGEYVDSPSDITVDALDDLDVRLGGFLGLVFFAAFRRLGDLGNASALRQFGTSGEPEAES